MKILIASCTVLSIFIVYTLYTQSRVYSQSQSLLEIHYLNIGQGDAIYIRTPSGADILVDTGPANSINKVLGHTLHFINNSLDAVFITHFDADHSGGLAILLRNFSVQYFVTASVYEKTDALLREIIDTHKAVHTKDRTFLHTTVAAGDKIIIDKVHEIYFEVLSPDTDDKTNEVNKQSLVMRLVYGDTYFLFMGDADKSIERSILQKYSDSLKANIIKLGHHGSRTSSAPEFLEKVAPEFAIISAGLDNSYGHPHKEVLETLAQLSFTTNDFRVSSKIKVRDTKTEDQIFYSDGFSVWEKGSGKKKAPSAP